MSSNFFFNCKKEFPEIRTALSDYINNNQLNWQKRFGIYVHGLEREFFKQFPKVDQLITEFDCPRYGLFKFDPNTCYGWHIDNPGRSCALNLLIDGYNSHTFYGEPILDDEKNTSGDFTNLREVTYTENKFVLMNVHKSHTVFNMDNTRHLLTISFHPAHGNFDKIKKYLMENNF